MTQNVEQSVLDKIAKLLAMSKDKNNENEAANAAALAQRLLLQHNLTVSEIESTGRVKGSVKEKQHIRRVKAGSGTKWRIHLAAAVANSSMCKVLHTTTTDAVVLFWVGREADAQLCTYVYEYLERELERLAHSYSRMRWDAAKKEAIELGCTFHEYEKELRLLNRHPLLAKRSWLEGAVLGVTKKLVEEYQKATASQAGTALVVVRDGEVKDYISKKYPKLKTEKRRPNNIDSHAYASGLTTGRNMQVRRGLNSGDNKNV